MRILSIVLLLVVCSPTLADAADDDPKPIGTATKHKAGSSVEITPYSGGYFAVKKINRTYDFIDPFDGQDGLLLDQEIETKYARPPQDGWATAAVRIRAYDVSRSGKLLKRYELVEQGAAGRLLDRYRYQVTAHGGCDSLDADVVYSAWTGKPILYASGRDSKDAVVQFRVPNGSDPGPGMSRWIGVYTNNAPYDEAVFGALEQAPRVVVTYAHVEAPLARALIDLGPTVTFEHSVEKLEIKPGLVVRIVLANDSVIEIPIKEDKLDMARAMLPAGATAKLLPAAWPDKPARRKQ